MRKKLLRITAISLAVLMLAFATACSSEESDETNESDIAEIEQGPIDVPVLVTDVEAGRRITEAMLTTKTISREAVAPNMMTSIDSVVGEFTTMKLYKGDYIYKDKLSSKKIEEDAADKVTSYSSNSNYIDISQFVTPNTGEDLQSTLQLVIDNNPQSTLYFPDGEYIISKPLVTHAIATKSVSIHLSDNAVIKASNNWSGSG
ncbi:MAG: SAF domain-containing protein, partial [Clostridia bacterium]|nr:SAF domain-containing protein [Clostridia bacterium]